MPHNITDAEELKHFGFVDVVCKGDEIQATKYTIK
jgi:acetyl-CoA carboxylase beta subunit